MEFGRHPALAEPAVEKPSQEEAAAALLARVDAPALLHALHASPETADGLANVYLREVVEQQTELPAEQVNTLLRWVALLGTVNREDDSQVQLLAENAGLPGIPAARAAIASLVRRRALSERGARNRLVELKPDVLRDHVLRTWLFVDVGDSAASLQPSEAAEALLTGVLEASLSGNLSVAGRAVLVSLARSERILRLAGRRVGLLERFAFELRAGIERCSASQRVKIGELLELVAEFRPLDCVELCRCLRTLSVRTESVEWLFGERNIGLDDVVLTLAWPLFYAAMGATAADDPDRILQELCSVAEEEFSIASRRARGLPNDGKRAKDLIGRTLAGGPGFWSDFEGSATRLGVCLVEDVAREAPTPARASVLSALLVPATSLERQHTWSEGFSFHIQTTLSGPDSPARRYRQGVVALSKRVAKGSRGRVPGHGRQSSRSRSVA
ncbi:hypothetical protein HYW18_02135 [Candidatus Uhrbacteria bacterium]|nr:hypothetical protein [Candidatus Uhrbacteria bacterium]